MRLIACHACHTQYDVTHVAQKKIRCRCGEMVANRDLEAMEPRLFRCASCSAQLAKDAGQCDYCGSQVERDDYKLSLVCPECYCRNADDARFCTACGVTFAPQSVEVEGEELPCPCCGCLMAVRELIGVAINECPKCKGLWVPDDELDFLISRAVQAQEESAENAERPLEPRKKSANPFDQRVHYRKCPRCSGMMARRNFRKTSGIIVDQCRDHGTWLDADELEALVGFITSGGRPQADAFMKELEADNLRQKMKAAAMQAQIEQQRTVRTGERQGVGGTLVEVLFDLLS